MRSPLLSPHAVWALVLASGLAACKTAVDHRADADAEVYDLVATRRAELFEDELSFTIDPPEDSMRRQLEEGHDPGPLDPVRCLEIASENNREYRRRKEDLYLVALDLTLERWDFHWQKFGTFAGFLDGTGTEGDTAIGASNFGLTRLLGTGAQIITDLGFNLVRDIGSGDGWRAVSNAGFTIVQPLLRGSGEKIVEENLTQAERDLVYEVRSFERFRRTFAVDVATRMLRLLQTLETVANEEANFENLTILRERNEALADAGRLSDIQVDQARQDELQSEDRLIDLREALELQLDGFKLFLGLPPEVELELDMSELERLRHEGLAEIDHDEELVWSYALASRLDYMNDLDRIDDSLRRIEVAADDLRAGAALTVDAGAESEDRKPLKYDPDDIGWTLGLSLDLPLERLPERNSYRRALIAFEDARRTGEEQRDTILADLRQALRETVAARETYRIQANSVGLAERRIESTTLNFEAGRADTRDLLEAQEDLVDAQNAVVRAIVDYTLARLELYRDMELLRVGPEGIRVDLESFTAYAEPDA